VIKNERQYAITKVQAEKFARALEKLTNQPVKGRRKHPLIHQAEVEAIGSQLADLRAEMEEYQSLRSGQRNFPKISSISEVPRILIQGRIAAGLTQKELARRLGIKEQQIQRYEATDYSSASLSRLREISRAVGLEGQGN